MKTIITIELTHTKHIPDLTDIIANKIYTFMKNSDAKSDVTVKAEEVEDDLPAILKRQAA